MGTVQHTTTLSHIYQNPVQKIQHTNTPTNRLNESTEERRIIHTGSFTPTTVHSRASRILLEPTCNNKTNPHTERDRTLRVRATMEGCAQVAKHLPANPAR